MWKLLAVCAAILLFLLVSAGLYAAGMPGYRAIAFTAFGSVVASVLVVAIWIGLEDRRRHVD